MALQKKTKEHIQIGPKFLNIDTETNNWRIWIWKIKFIFWFNKSSTRYWSNLFVFFFTQFFFLPYQKQLDLIPHTILLWKFQTKERFNKSHLIIHQILTFKILWIFLKNARQNHSLFWWLILLLHHNPPRFGKTR